MMLFCDIDGTLFDNEKRRVFIKASEHTPKDWDRFYSDEETKQDLVVPGAQKGLFRLMTTFDRVLFLTGRPERCRNVTKWQFMQHFGYCVDDHQILMRKDHDWRPGHIYKEEWIKKILPAAFPGFFIDDDERNTEMYARYGVFLKAPECWSAIR